jgi:hypothetical protein
VWESSVPQTRLKIQHDRLSTTILTCAVSLSWRRMSSGKALVVSRTQILHPGGELTWSRWTSSPKARSSSRPAPARRPQRHQPRGGAWQRERTRTAGRGDYSGLRATMHREACGEVARRTRASAQVRKPGPQLIACQTATISARRTNQGNTFSIMKLYTLTSRKRIPLTYMCVSGAWSASAVAPQP